MFIDIEGNGNLGWSNQYPSSNRDVFNGFRDYIEGHLSQDSTCPSANDTIWYQPAVYSSPDQWSYSFGSQGTITEIPVWTSEYCCHSSYPTGFGSGSTGAQWFGGGGDNRHIQWQFDESPDYDQLQEPVVLPWFGFSLGD
jgi:hypothetical protein